jgi:hypothetical protein
MLKMRLAPPLAWCLLKRDNFPSTFLLGFFCDEEAVVALFGEDASE